MAQSRLQKLGPLERLAAIAIVAVTVGLIGYSLPCKWTHSCKAPIAATFKAK